MNSSGALPGVPAADIAVAGGRNHLAALDLFRALAVLMVAAAHFGRAFGPAWPGTEAFCAAYGRLGVEVFFVISGYVIPYSLARAGHTLAGYPRFLARRLLRLYPPYLAALALTLAIMAAWRPALGLPWTETWGSAALSLAWLHAPVDNPVFWSLLVEMEYYLLVGLLFPLLAARRWPVVLATLAGLLLLGRLEWGGAFHLPQYLPIFAMGFALFWLGERRIGKIGFGALLLALWVWDRRSAEATAGCLAALGIAAAGAWRGPWPAWTAPLFFVGTLSYSLFLIHLPLGGKVIVAARHLVGNGAAWGAPLFMLALVVAVGAAAIFHRFVELPSHRLAQRMGKKG